MKIVPRKSVQTLTIKSVPLLNGQHLDTSEKKLTSGEMNILQRQTKTCTRKRLLDQQKLPGKTK